MRFKNKTYKTNKTMNNSKEKRVAARNHVAARKQPVGVFPSTSKKGFEGFAGFVTKKKKLNN